MTFVWEKYRTASRVSWLRQLPVVSSLPLPASHVCQLQENWIKWLLDSPQCRDCWVSDYTSDSVLKTLSNEMKRLQFQDVQLAGTLVYLFINCFRRISSICYANFHSQIVETLLSIKSLLGLGLVKSLFKFNFNVYSKMWLQKMMSDWRFTYKIKASNFNIRVKKFYTMRTRQS